MAYVEDKISEVFGADYNDMLHVSDLLRDVIEECAKVVEKREALCKQDTRTASRYREIAREIRALGEGEEG